MTRSFIPHAECTVASGDCFHEGRCLGSCRQSATKKWGEMLANLEGRVQQLERAIYAKTKDQPND